MSIPPKLHRQPPYPSSAARTRPCLKHSCGKSNPLQDIKTHRRIYSGRRVQVPRSWRWRLWSQGSIQWLQIAAHSRRTDHTHIRTEWNPRGNASHSPGLTTSIVSLDHSFTVNFHGIHLGIVEDEILSDILLHVIYPWDERLQGPAETAPYICIFLYSIICLFF